jgi:hypothetical protein
MTFSSSHTLSVSLSVCPSHSHTDPSGDRNPSSERKRKVAKKPLFLRLLEKAQAQDELEDKKKMDLYNLQKLERKKGKNPSKEEIKDRISQGEG